MKKRHLGLVGRVWQRTEVLPRSLCKLKQITKYFLLAELLDVVTTTYGVYFIPRLWESNPLHDVLGGWAPLILIKLLVTLLIVIILESVDDWPWLVRILPLIAALPVMWNIFAILAELAAVMI